MTTSTPPIQIRCPALFIVCYNFATSQNRPVVLLFIQQQKNYKLAPKCNMKKGPLLTDFS